MAGTQGAIPARGQGSVFQFQGARIRRRRAFLERRVSAGRHSGLLSARRSHRGVNAMALLALNVDSLPSKSGSDEH